MRLEDSLVHSSIEAIVGLDAQFRINLFNPAAEKIFGYRAVEVMGQPVTLIVPDHLIGPLHERMQALTVDQPESEQSGHIYEITGRRKDNREVPLEAVTSMVQTADGQLQYVAFLRDITARRQTEHQLRKLSRAVEQSPTVVVITDVRGRIEYVNAKFSQITGYTPGEVIGQNPNVLKSGETSDTDYQQMWLTILAGHEWRGLFHNKKKNGELYWESALISPIMNDVGQITHFIALKEDITEQRRAEDALRHSLADNRALLNAIPDLMFRISRDGIFLDYKPSESVDLYLPPNQFLGKSIFEVLPGEISQQTGQAIRQALDSERGRSQAFEYRLPINGHFNHYEARVTASGPDEVLMLVRDITQRKRAEDAEHEQRILAEALRDTTAALNSSLNLDEVLDRILDNAGRVASHDAANIMLIEGQFAHVARAHGYAERGLNEWIMALAMPVSDLPNLRQLTQTDEPVLMADTRTDPRWYELPQTRWVRSYIGVPIRVQGQVVGVLNLDSATPGFFTAAHGERLKAFAYQAATAIENAQLVSETRRQAERERLINQITNRIRNSMDIDAIIKTTVFELGRILGASRCLIRLGADADYMPVAHEFDQSGIEPMGERSTGLLIGVREKIMARQTLDLPDTTRGTPALFQLGIRAVLATPIMVRNTLLGALVFHECLRPRHWQRDEVELIETIAAQVGVAIENARLYHETRRQLGELAILHTAAIATADSTSHTEALFKVAQSVRDALGTVKVSTLLLEPETEDLIVRASAGFSKTEIERVKIKIGQGVTGWVAQTGQPALIPDVSADPRYISVDPQVRSELCVPLRTSMRVVGVLNVESHEVDAFTERDLQLLTTLSHNLTIIIENIRLLEEVRAANERLTELDRLKSQFLANMSHELRTPLNAIIGFSELLGDGVAGPLNADQSEYITNINTSGRHLLTLITDILDLSKIQAGRMTLDRQDVSIAALLAEAQTFIVPLAARKQQHFSVDVPPDLPALHVDPLRIKQVLINLLSNACKYTPDAGMITLRVSLIDRDLLLVSVSDTGRGIPPAEQAYIFEEFRQIADTTNREGGTGLGLAIARRLIELHGGKIWVDSPGQPGLGSTFRFTLPVQSSPAASGLSTRSTPTPIALIVEDDHAFSGLLTLHLQQAGYRTRQCYHAGEAIALARELKPDLITLDMVLPDGDGWSLLREIKAAPELRNVGVLIISSMEQAQAEVTPGRVEYLPKPLLKNELMQAIGRLKHRQSDQPVRVLVVDDDPMLVELLHAIMPQPKFEVTTATNGAHAIEQIMAQLPELLILDLLMPDMNGFELLAALRSDPRTRDLPVIVLTAKTLNSAERAELSQAAQSVMTKTEMRRDRLLAEIHRLRQAVSQPPDA